MAPVSRTETQSSDHNLIQRIIRQDQTALTQLYQGYGDLVYSLALRVVRNPGWAEEVTQDIFLKVWQHPERWNPALGRFSSWLLTITRNAAIDRLRKEQRQPLQQTGAVEAIADTVTQPQMGDDPRWFDGQLLARLLKQLPPEQHELIELAFFHGFTHSELAHHLDLPLGTVKTRLRSGLQKLRNLWEEHGQT